MSGPFSLIRRARSCPRHCQFPRLNMAEASEMQLLSDWLKDCGGVTHEVLLDMFVRRHFMPLPLRHLGWGGHSERASAKEIGKVSYTNRAGLQAPRAL